MKTVTVGDYKAVVEILLGSKTYRYLVCNSSSTTISKIFTK